MFAFMLDYAKILKHKYTFLLSGLVYSILSVVISVLVFPEYSSITSICLLAIPSAFLFLESHKNVKEFISDYLEEYLLFFFGVFLGFLIMYIILPENVVADLSKEQRNVIISYTYKSGHFYNLGENFVSILINNLFIFVMCILFSIFYCTCGIVFLSWHASILAYYVKYNLSKNLLLGVISFFAIMPHGVLEFGAYSLAGAAAMNMLLYFFDKKHHNIKHIKKLIFVGLIMLICAAYIESACYLLI